jgi:signal transducing adaptor molecule
MVQVYEDLVAQGHSFPVFQPSPKRAAITDKEKEEEELQLALAISLSTQQPERINNPPSPVKRNPAPAYLFQVRALYDFHPTDTGELRLQKGDIVNVHDHTTFPDWWKGSLNGNVGIFPANYVEKIQGPGNELETKQPQDETERLLQQMQFVHQFKQDLERTDPLGHDYATIERLQQDYQKVVHLVPIVMKHATMLRKEQDELSALYEQYSMATNSYHQLMADYQAFQAQQLAQQLAQPMPLPHGYQQGYQPGFPASQPPNTYPPQGNYQQPY